MANRKRRSEQQIMEEQSNTILRQSLPEEWVIHDYRPDYGIDLVLEIFEYTTPEKVAETLGEQLFIQLKSVKNITIEKHKIYDRKNVEKYSLEKKETFVEIDIFKFKIDVSLLLTIQSMGFIVPVMLFIVDLETKEIYYVCLTDYIDKILYHEDLSLQAKETKTLYIPLANRLSNPDYLLFPIKNYYAKRVKWNSAFIKFNYQYGEIEYGVTFENIKQFIFIIKNFDIWQDERFSNDYEELTLIESLVNENSQDRLIELVNLKINRNVKEFLDFEDDFYRHSDNPLEQVIINLIIKPFWGKLSNYLYIYEETWRESYLPISIF